jgi:dihydroxyacetone kinase-like predicted kinase
MIRDNVSGIEIYQALVAGKNRVVSFREELNRINVFPVNDSDTGNNLSATLTYITETVTPENSPDEMVKMIADASLSGARGNSGIIFAQFINGMAEELSGKGFEGDNFPEVVNKAVPYAYKAVSKPAEGTILGSSVSTLTYYVVGLFK